MCVCVCIPCGGGGGVCVYLRDTWLLCSLINIECSVQATGQCFREHPLATTTQIIDHLVIVEYYTVAMSSFVILAFLFLQLSSSNVQTSAMLHGTIGETGVPIGTTSIPPPPALANAAGRFNPLPFETTWGWQPPYR